MNGVTGCDGKQARLLYLRVIRIRRSVLYSFQAEIIGRSQFFRHVHKISKKLLLLRHVPPPVRSYAKTRLPLDGFS